MPVADRVSKGEAIAFRLGAHHLTERLGEGGLLDAAGRCGIQNSPPGSVWAVGTEIHLVNRLANEVQPQRTVLSLDQFGCLCSTMFRVSPNHLLWVLEGLVDGQVHNRIVVPAEQKRWTKVALDRMLSIQ